MIILQADVPLLLFWENKIASSNINPYVPSQPLSPFPFKRGLLVFRCNKIAENRHWKTSHTTAINRTRTDIRIALAIVGCFDPE
jgi:hypothetical protein